MSLNPKFANLAKTTLAANLGLGDVSCTVQAGYGAIFPTCSSGEYYYCTITNTTGTQREIVKVTARSTDTFTIGRAQGGSTAYAFSAGDTFALSWTKESFTDYISRSILSAKWYLASGSGAGDDTAEIQETWAASGGKLFFLPNGTYPFSGRFDGSGGDIGLTNLYSGFVGRMMRYNEPQYDMDGNGAPGSALATNDFHRVGSVTVPASKQYDVIRGVGNISSGGANSGFRFINYDITSNGVTNAYGVIGVINNAGSGTTKSLYGRAVAKAGCTGDVVGLDIACGIDPGSTPANAVGIMVSMGDYASRTIWMLPDGATARVNWGILADNQLGFADGFIRGYSRYAYDPTADGDAFSWINANTSAVLFDVDHLGNVRGQNLTFLNTGKRIYGDLTNTTHANRVLFQTLTANSPSNIGVIPSGTGNTSALRLYNSSDPDNASLGSIIINNAWFQLQTYLTGSGASLPIRFNTANVQALSIDVTQNVIVGTAALGTTATTGFPWIPSCAGVPTGAPTAPYTNAAACVVDTTNSRVYFLVGGTWKYAALT